MEGRVEIYIKKKKSFLYFNLAALGLSCCMWDLAPCPGIEPRPPALGVQSLSHWITIHLPRTPYTSTESTQLHL